MAPLRVALPFQTVETINESAQDRQLNLFQAASKAKPWRNRLIWGDKKYVLPSLLPEFAGKDRAARLWCENATALTGTPWAYLKVRQEEYNGLQPTLFADLIALETVSQASR